MKSSYYDDFIRRIDGLSKHHAAEHGKDDDFDLVVSLLKNAVEHIELDGLLCVHTNFSALGDIPSTAEINGKKEETDSFTSKPILTENIIL